MMILRILIAIFAPLGAEGLRQTAPDLLTGDSAREHAFAAELASVAFDVDRDVLLAIAHHESRYSFREVTPEAGGRFSCGTMTPEPLADRSACESARASVLAGYVAGARHLRGWIDACRGQQRCALLGYAGGWAAIRACSVGPVHAERSGGTIDLCKTPDVFLWRARWISRSRARARSVAPTS